MSTIHALKIIPEHFEPVLKNLKLAELRKNDRDFQVGDFLMLQEWNSSQWYTGRVVTREVVHIANVDSYLPGYVLLSMKSWA